MAVKEPGPGIDITMTLDRLEPGQGGVILDVDLSSPLGRRLLELGVVPGLSARLVRRAPLGDPLEISVGHSLLSLRRYEAALVSVHLEA